MEIKNYYVRMRIENHILERYGFVAEIHATKEDGLDVFYAFLFNEESVRTAEGRFNKFDDAHDFLKEKVQPIAFDVVAKIMIRGRYAEQDLEKIERDFEL